MRSEKSNSRLLDDGTYSYAAAAGQINLAVGNDGYPRELVLNQNGRALRAARIAEVSLQGRRGGHRRCSNHMSAGYQLSVRTVYLPSRAMTIAFMSRNLDGRKRRSRPAAPMHFLLELMMIWLSSCAAARPR